MSQHAPEAKKNHHYVWSHYLRRWSADGENVWRTTETGLVRTQNTKAFVRENYFYKASHVSKEQINLIGEVFRGASENAKSKQVAVLKDICDIQVCEEFYLSLGKKDELIAAHLNALKCNVIENRHCQHENAAMRILDSLVQGGVTVLDEDNNFTDFVEFLGHQTTRTKAWRERTLTKNRSWIKAEDGSEEIFKLLNECDWLMGYMCGIVLSDGLCSTRAKDNHCLLKNYSAETFITSDQPVINVHPNLSNNTNIPPDNDEYDFFFPVSPTTAYMINRSDIRPIGISDVSLSFVQAMNEKIAVSSRTHIVGDCEEVVEKYKKMVPRS